MNTFPLPNDPEILDRIRDAIFSLDNKWRFTYINKAGELYLGIKNARKDLLGKNIWKAIPLAKKLPHYKKIKQIFQHRQTMTFEMVSPISNKWRKISIYPGDNGVSIVVQDIAREKEIEQKLKSEKEWSTSILSSIQDGFVVLDRKLQYLYVNETAEKLIGLPKEKLLGNKFSQVFPDHNIDLKHIIPVVKNTWVQKKVATLEVYFRPTNQWYSLLIYPFNDKFSVIFRDITYEKQMKDELKKIKRQLDTVFKNVEDGIVIQEKDGKVIYVNESAAKATGFASAEQMLKAPQSNYENTFELYNEKGTPLAWNDLPGRKILFQNKQSDELIIRYKERRKGRERWVRVKATKIPSLHDNYPCVVTLLHDITDLKEAEYQKDNFLSMVSHELKTPLTSMKAYAQILERKCLELQDADTSHMVAKISSDIERLTELVRSLLEVSWTHEGEIALQKKHFSLNALLGEVIDDIQPLTRHVMLLENEKKVRIYADRSKIEQVLINLLMNAIKYSEENEKIVLKTFVEKKSIIIAVKDRGSGIPAKDQEKIFKRFYQSSKHNTFPGMGLGLYISSEIINAHGGKIWVKSKEGKGSTFYISIPL